MEFLLIGITLTVTFLMAAAALRLSLQLHKIVHILRTNDRTLAGRDDNLKTALQAHTEAIKTIVDRVGIEGIALPVFMDIEEVIDFFVGPTGEIRKDRMN